MATLLSLQAQTTGGSKKPGKPVPLVITFTTEPNPPAAGAVEFRVAVKDAKGTPIADADVSALLVMPSMPEMKVNVTLPAAGGGAYRAMGQLEMPGRWDATITVTRDGQRPATKRVLVIVQ